MAKRRESNKDLMERLRSKANMENFVTNPALYERGLTGDVVREATLTYRSTWLAPILDEVERRLCKRS